MNTSHLKHRWWDLLGAILLIVAIMAAATRLDATDWSKELSIVPTIALFGVIAGLALGQSRFSSSLVAFFTLAYGLYIIPWQLGVTIRGDLSWPDKLRVLMDRGNLVSNQLSNRASVTDSIAFVILMAILFWILSTHSGYSLTRHGNSWLAIFPIGLALVIIQSFDPGEPRKVYFLTTYIFFGLILVARMAYRHRESEWAKTHTTLPPHLSLDFLRYAFIAVTIIVLAAWTFPALANVVPTVAKAAQPLRQSWSEIKENWKNAFASLNSSISVVSEVYGDNIILGQGSQHTDTPILIVERPSDIPTGIRLYWRAVVYDTYNDGQWFNTVFTRQNFNPATEIIQLPEEEGRWQNTFKVTPLRYSLMLYSPPQPFWVSPVGQAIMTENPDETIDISGFRASTAIRPQETYETQASLANPTIKQMKESGIDYPAWIKERYLQIPETITPRTLQLAQDIVEGLETPYDKVVAITDYLRINYEYQETIPRIPRDNEPIDWFLFDYKKGFCNYYATSQVLMLRSIGIPARIAVGYAQGELQDDGRYIVRQRDSHAWPEVYFSGIGWVEFEPTSAQPEIIRLSGVMLDPSGNPIPLEPLDENPDEIRRENLERLRQEREDLAQDARSALSFNWKLFNWVTILVISIGLIFLAWKYRSRIDFSALPIFLESSLLRMGIQPPKFIHSWAIWAALPPLSKAYIEINRALNRLEVKPSINQTPAERAQILGQQLPPTMPAVTRLLHEYQIDTFSKKAGNQITATSASQEIRKLSRKAYWQKFLKRFQKPLSRHSNYPAGQNRR